MVIAVDAMGGDIPVHAPVEAAVRAANDFEQEIILVGNRDQVVTELDKHIFPKKTDRSHPFQRNRWDG